MTRPHQLSFVRPDISVVRLGPADVMGRTDSLVEFERLVLDCSPFYPAIDSWLDAKVRPGIVSGGRVAYVAFADHVPIATAVVKPGVDTKFCHLRVVPEYQDAHLGEFFFARMAIDASFVAERFHFTLPRRLWRAEGPFFRSFAFEDARVARRQYRSGDVELEAAGPASNVLAVAQGKLAKLAHLATASGLSLDPQLLISIKPRWADAVFSGRKRVEIRRTFSCDWAQQRACFYVSRPRRVLIGDALIADVVAAPPAQIWRRFSGELDCSFDEFSAYTSGKESVFALVIVDARKYRREVDLAALARLTSSTLRPPVSHRRLDSRSPWGRAVSLAALLNG